MSSNVSCDPGRNSQVLSLMWNCGAGTCREGLSARRAKLTATVAPALVWDLSVDCSRFFRKYCSNKRGSIITSKYISYVVYSITAISFFVLFSAIWWVVWSCICSSGTKWHRCRPLNHSGWCHIMLCHQMQICMLALGYYSTNKKYFNGLLLSELDLCAKP